MEMVKCDFCDAKIEEKELIGNTAKSIGWSWGLRGKVGPFGPICCLGKDELKRACPEEICKARLLVWARS